MTPEDHAILPITGGELTVAARAASGLRKLFKRPDPVGVLKYREHMRKSIRENLEWPSRESPEIIVVRLSRKDKYPETDSWLYGLFGNSPWFKYEVKRVDDRHLEVYAKIERVTIRGRKARSLKINHPDDEETRKVCVVGRIPFERIAHIDWEPDAYYSAPRFYVNYGRRGPFREVVLYERAEWASGIRGPHDRPDHDLFGIPGVKYQGESGNPWRWMRYSASRLKFAWELKRQGRKDFKEFPP